eukprot:symbB.v1.2.029838.t1/scaffold3307.1/size59352/5
MPEVVAPQDVKLGLIPQQVDGQVLVKVGWLNIPKGCSGSSVACCQEVGKGGWAESVGIKNGAKITKLNDIPLQGMLEADFKAALKQRPLKILFEQDTFEVVLQDPGEKLGCAFAGTPPGNTSVSKVAPDSVAERNHIQMGFQLLTLNGQKVGELTETTFRESLKARPVRLLFQVPKKEEPLFETPKAPADSSSVFEVTLEDAASKLGCGFAGLPPEPVAVGKVSPGTFAERNKIQSGYLLMALNGIEMKELNPERFRELLKARPVRLRMQIPQSEEKEKIVKAVVKQENAVTAMQAIARAPVLQSSHQCRLFGIKIKSGGQRVRRQWRARGKAGSLRFDVTLEDASSKLGCGFAGVPPEPVAVGKVSPGTFAERNKIQSGYLLMALNGIEMKELNPERFRELLKARPVRLGLQIPPSQATSVVKQENAVTAMQAIARGQRVRRQWRQRKGKEVSGKLLATASDTTGDVKDKSETPQATSETSKQPEAIAEKSEMPQATGETSKQPEAIAEKSETPQAASETGVLKFVVQAEIQSLGIEFDMPPLPVVVRKATGI